MDNIRLLTAWLISSGLLAALHAAVGPKFTYAPEPIVAPLGDEVEFECSLDVPAEQIWWKHNRKKLSVVHFNATKSQLLLRVEHESQVGDYQCVAWYGASALASTPARLTLARLGPPTAEFRRKLIVTGGNNVLINCSVPISNPPAGIQYYKNNLSLQGGKVLSSGALLLANVTPADSGQYSCSVTNTYVTGNPWFMPSYHNLNVVTGNRERRPPQFTFLPPYQYLTQIGLNVTLECVGFGEPVPRTSWKRAMGSLANDRMQTTIAGLQILDVRATDEGTYICEIDNGVSPMLTHRISLIVQEPPVVLRGPEDRKPNEGGRISLECIVRGKPTPSIHWFLNGDLVINDSHVRVTGGRLDLDRIEKRHAGWYQCMAQNELGATYDASQVLVVPQQVTFNTTGDHSLDAPHNHNPPQHRKKHHKKKKEMTPPSKPLVSQLSDTSVMVRWDHPRTGLPICFFKVQYRQLKRGKEWMTNNEDIPAYIYSYEVTNLQPDSEYKFRIAAVYSNNDNMQGTTSAKFHLRSEIDPRDMPSAPRITHLAPNGANSIKIFWDYDGKDPRAEGFYVYYRSTSSAGDYMKSNVDSVDLRNHVITHLDADTAYDFKMQSFRAEAASEFSEILTQKTERLSTISPPVVMSTPPTVEADEGGKGGHQLHVTLAAVLGGLAIILVLCTSIICCNKHRQHQSNTSEDDDVDKSRHIQLEAIHMNGHAGAHLSSHTTGLREGNVLVSNGCCSKMNITSNPLDPEESKTKNVMEIAFITTNTCDDTCSSSVLTARLASAAVLPTCAMESESWRRPDIPRAVDNYV